MDSATIWGNWAGAICTLGIFSILYKENPVYRFFEHIFVGLAAGWSGAYVWHNYVVPTVQTDIFTDGKYLYIIPVLLSLMIYFLYVPSLNWLARYPMSFVIGYNAGYILAYNPRPVIDQITATFLPFWGPEKYSVYVNNFLLFIGVVAVLLYFFFTIKRDNAVIGYSSSLGRFVILIALAAAFGNTILYRLTLFIGRMQFLLGDFLGDTLGMQILPK